MHIPQIDLSRQTSQIKTDLMQELESIVDSGQFILGPWADRLEQHMADYVGVNHAVGCNSGTDALILALMALDIGPGDEVITTPFSFFASGAAIARAGATPVFADIDPKRYVLDPETVKKAVTSRTKAIIPVHIFGQMADMEALTEIAAANNLHIVEDAAQAIGARWADMAAGSIGAVNCFSFYPTKNLSAAGDAGMLTTADEDLARRLRALRSHGEHRKYHHSELGMNSRLAAFNAAAVLVKLKYVDNWNRRRREIAGLYTSLFEEKGLAGQYIHLPEVADTAVHVYHQYSIRCQERDALMQYLRDNGIGSAVHYPDVIYRQPVFAADYPQGLCPVAERTTATILSLPMFAELRDEEVAEVVTIIERFFKS